MHAESTEPLTPPAEGELPPPPPSHPNSYEGLSFLARYFGRSVDAQQLAAGLPRDSGRPTSAILQECAARAGLAVMPIDTDKEQIKASMLPALAIAPSGACVVVLDRKGDKMECADPRTGVVTWMDFRGLQGDGSDLWYSARPVFFFDARSLLYYVREPQRWFWDTLKANRSIYGWALLATLFVNVVGAAIPFYAMAVYDRVVPNNALDSLWVLTSAAVVMVVFDLATKLLRSYLLEAAGRRADLVLSAQVFAQTLRMRTAQRPASGGVLANSVRDFEAVREFFTASTLALLGDLPFVLFYLLLIGIVGGVLVFVPLVLIPVSLGIALYIRRPLKRIMNETTRDSTQRTAHLFEVMNGLDSVKALGGDAWARQRWEALCAKLADRGMKSREYTSLSSYLSATLFSLETILIVMFGAILVADGKLTLGQLIACSMLASRAVAPIGQIAGLIIRWEQTKLSLEALEKIMQTPTDDRKGGLFVSQLRGEVELREVEFKYGEKSLALRGVGLNVQAGERVGIIGRVGSGKTTVFKLLLNMYDPGEGSVLIDGIPVREYDSRTLRRLIGYVPQDVLLFHGDIRQNILLGASDASDDDILYAMQISGLDKMLAQLPDGLATQVGERGDNLSGGQRQLVGLTRALVRRPKLLLLDEPTSMMDPHTEQLLIASLKKNLPGTTILLITHRMAMLPLVDRLVVMEQGRIAADGPIAEVLRKLGGSTEGGNRETRVGAA